jgi:pimeloyl-ACP methyl ester carboxylesterase
MPSSRTCHRDEEEDMNDERRAAHGALLLALAALAPWAVSCSRRDATPPAEPAAVLAPVEVRAVSFPTDDEGVVHADEYGAGPRGVVMVHGARFDKESWRPQAEALARAGLRVVSIDLRGTGASRGGTQWSSRYDGVELDVLAAVRWLRASGATSVSVVGGSLGGFAAAEAAVVSEPGTIDRLFLLAPSPVEHPERIQGKKLFVVARDDVQGIGTPRLPEIRAQHDRAPEPKELLVLEGSAHAQYLLEGDQAGRVMQEMLRFLTEP